MQVIIPGGKKYLLKSNGGRPCHSGTENGYFRNGPRHAVCPTVNDLCRSLTRSHFLLDLGLRRHQPRVLTVTKSQHHVIESGSLRPGHRVRFEGGPMRVVAARRRRRMIPPIRFAAATRAVGLSMSSGLRRRTPPRHRAMSAGPAVPDAAGPALNARDGHRSRPDESGHRPPA